MLTIDNMMQQIHILDIEAAINYWRVQPDAISGVRLNFPLRALAQVYGQMVFHKQAWLDIELLSAQAMQAWLQWYETTPDTPCIAICSTSQGDDVCKGCGRSFEEVRHWTAMTPVEKRQVWHRIINEGSAWRFTRYRERVPVPTI